MRTPLDLIQIYWDRVYNNAEVELVREVCADPILRHDPDYVTPLSHEEQIARVLRSTAMKPLFTHEVLHADDTFVTSVWNMVSRDGRDIRLCGIEVFRAENGRFTDCWNSTYMRGLWADAGATFDPAMLTPPGLVSTPIEIDADWLERALAAGGRVTAQRIATAPVVSLIGHGTTSATVRVRVAYNSGFLTAPTSFICKIGRNGGNVSTVSPFERERLAYGLFGQDPPFRIPKLYFGASDEAGLCNLLLEDLSGHARPGDQIAGCSIAEATAVIDELARFHRSYLGRPVVGELDWLIRPEKLLPAYRADAAALREWLGHRLSPQEFGIIDHFEAVAEQLLTTAGPWQTLIHGDGRVDNILFEADGDAIRACLIDWQSLSRGDPLHDVAYFLGGSVSPADRRACESTLLARYARRWQRPMPVSRVRPSRRAIGGTWCPGYGSPSSRRPSPNGIRTMRC